MTQQEIPKELVIGALDIWRELLHSMTEFNEQINSIPPEQQEAFFALHVEGFFNDFENKQTSLISGINQQEKLETK